MLVVGPTSGDATAHILEQTTRALAVVDAAEANAVGALDGRVELAILDPGRGDAVVPRAVRVLAREDGAPGGYSRRDVAWLGRHLCCIDLSSGVASQEVE